MTTGDKFVSGLTTGAGVMRTQNSQTHIPVSSSGASGGVTLSELGAGDWKTEAGTMVRYTSRLIPKLPPPHNKVHVITIHVEEREPGDEANTVISCVYSVARCV